MNTESLLLVTALLELGTGVALLAAPSFIVELLLGAELASPQAFVLGRITGVALISLGVACWLARSGEGSTARTGLVAGMLIYNVSVPILLIHAALASRMEGIALWPASVLHLLLAIWCLARLRSR